MMLQSVPEPFDLQKERTALANSGSMQWAHWLTIGLAVLVTVAAWYGSKALIKEKSKARFESESSRVVAMFSERMEKYEDALWSGVAAIRANNGNMNHVQWRSFASSLRVQEKYPGINGIGVIFQVPDSNMGPFLTLQKQSRPDFNVHHLSEHGLGFALPVLFIEPEKNNSAAVGLDVTYELNRREAALSARDSGKARISGAVILEQDESKTPGFLFFAPFYGVESPWTAEDRQIHFKGLVYAPFVVKNLIAGVLEKSNRLVWIRVSENDTTLYDELRSTEPGYDANPLFSRKMDVDFYGRRWTFDIQTNKDFRDEVDNRQPVLILSGGLFLDTLLLALLVLLSRARRQALNYANKVTEKLEQDAQKLLKTNADLESFAYIVSHDLKTPLRGISDLTVYLEEDLEDYIKSKDANPQVANDIERIRVQINRMDSLIKGILDYSTVGLREELIEEVDTRKSILDIARSISVSEERLVLDGDFPILKTYRVRFEQTLANLIGNAFKYHNDPANAKVTLAAVSFGDFYSFSVADNGPGIDQKYHKKIFEVFQSLQSKDEIESSGVGLSIVKKAVESLGGMVTVESQLGYGTTFRFLWPKHISVPTTVPIGSY